MYLTTRGNGSTTTVLTALRNFWTPRPGDSISQSRPNGLNISTSTNISAQVPQSARGPRLRGAGLQPAAGERGERGPGGAGLGAGRPGRGGAGARAHLRQVR